MTSSRTCSPTLCTTPLLSPDPNQLSPSRGQGARHPTPNYEPKTKTSTWSMHTRHSSNRKGCSASGCPAALRTWAGVCSQHRWVATRPCFTVRRDPNSTSTALPNNNVQPPSQSTLFTATRHLCTSCKTRLTAKEK